MNPDIKLIYGPPGTGKTYRLLTIFDEELQNDIDPSRIAFISFTRKAIAEAKQRVQQKFELVEDDIKHFRTLHSLAYLYLSHDHHTKPVLFKKSHFDELSNITGWTFTYKSNHRNKESILPDINTGTGMGDKLLFIENLARLKMISLHDEWCNGSGYDVTWPQLKQFAATYYKYKQTYDLCDYTDLLIRMIDSKMMMDDIDVVIIDEAQDLTPLQWKLVNQLFQSVQRVYIAGDPDQCIFEWAGADPNYLLSLPYPKEVLPQSYRLLPSIHKFALSIINKCETTYNHDFKPVTGKGNGTIHYLADEYWLDINKYDGDWLLLARHRYLLNRYVKIVREQGLLYDIAGVSSISKQDVLAIINWEKFRRGDSVSFGVIPGIYKKLSETMYDKEKYLNGIETAVEGTYTLKDLKQEFGLLSAPPWFTALTKISFENREYYRAVLRRGGRLLDESKIHINTIHRVKGSEADNVVILPDITRCVYDQYGDAEHRTFYVGVTRAKKNLFLIEPTGVLTYQL